MNKTLRTVLALTCLMVWLLVCLSLIAHHDLRALLWIGSALVMAAYAELIEPVTNPKKEGRVMKIESARVHTNDDGQTVLLVVDEEYKAYELLPGDAGYDEAKGQLLTACPWLDALFEESHIDDCQS